MSRIRLTDRKWAFICRLFHIRTSLPEVVGSAGNLVNPEDPDRFGAAIKRVLGSPELRNDLSARGLARVKQFTWDRVAVETSTLYVDVSGNKL